MMTTIDHVCVFAHAAGERLAAARRLVVAAAELFGPELVEADLAFDAETRFLAVTLRFGPGVVSRPVRERLGFWTARAGGRATPVAALTKSDREGLLAHVAACELRLAHVGAASLANEGARFFAELGVPAARAKGLDRPVLAMDVGGPGWEGVRYDRDDRVLFVAAPISPPVGDVVPLVVRIPAAPRPIAVAATVVEVRTTASAGPGRAAGYALRLDDPPPELEAAFARSAGAPPRGGDERAAPRYPVKAPVKILASPPSAPPDAPAITPGPAVVTPTSAATPTPAPRRAATPPPRARIEYATEQELQADFVENLSQGGAFVRTPSPLPVGTAVSLQLRLPNGADLDAAAVVAFVNRNGMGVRFTLDDEADAILSAAIAHISARPRRALVVDDDALVRRMLADALSARGFEVLTAEDATTGLRTLSEELLALDLLVTDVRMPGMDGEAFVRLIRGGGGETELAIVVVTAATEPGVEPRLEAAGADAVLDKALGPELVAQAADAVLERKRLAATA